MKALIALGILLAASVPLIAADPEVRPLDGWHAFVAVCSAHDGPTDAVLMQRFDGDRFVDGDTWRVECGDVEFVIPYSWYAAGKAEQKAKAEGKGT